MPATINPPASYEDTVKAAFKSELGGREPTAAELDRFTKFLQGGGSQDNLIRSLQQLPERADLDRKNMIMDAFRNELDGREPSPAEFKQWETFLKQGGSQENLIKSIQQSPERKRLDQYNIEDTKVSPEATDKSPKLLRFVGDNNIYYSDGGRLRLVPNPETLIECGLDVQGISVLPVADKTRFTIDQPLPDLNVQNNIIRLKSTGQVYLREGNILKPIMQFDPNIPGSVNDPQYNTFLARGIRQEWVQDVDDISQYTVGSAVANPISDPGGAMAEKVAHKQMPRLPFPDFGWENTPEAETAREAAEAEYGPWYAERLHDYLTPLETARTRASEDKPELWLKWRLKSSPI